MRFTGMGESPNKRTNRIPANSGKGLLSPKQLPRRQILQVDNHSIEFTWESCHPVTLNLATKMSTGIREESVRHMVELEGSVGGWANDELVDLL